MKFSISILVMIGVFGWKTASCQSISITSFYDNGDIYKVIGTETDPLKKSDVIRFRDTYTLRVIDVSDNEVKLRSSKQNESCLRIIDQKTFDSLILKESVIKNVYVKGNLHVGKLSRKIRIVDSFIDALIITPGKDQEKLNTLDSLEIEYCGLNYFIADRCFIDPTRYSKIYARFFHAYDCVFPASIKFPIKNFPTAELELDNNEFIKRLTVECGDLRGVSLDNNTYNGGLTMDDNYDYPFPDSEPYYIHINGGTFYGTTLLDITDRMDYIGSDIVIRDTLAFNLEFYLTRLNYADIDSISVGSMTKFLKNIYFAEESTFQIDTALSLREFDPGTNLILNAAISFKSDHKLNEKFHWHIQQILNKEKFLLNENKELDNKTRLAGLEWLDYQKRLYQVRLARESDSLGSFFSLIWYGILAVVVNFGYEGEWNFVRISLILISVWAFIFFVKFKTEVKSFVRNGDSVKDKKKSSKSFVNFFIEICQCFWFSFIIFFTPKFEARYFSFSSRMVAVLLFEWVVGLFCLILFLIFIASKYPFINTLFGF